MKRLLGFKKKRELKPRGTAPGPSFVHAMQEYHQTVAPQTSNDDGTLSEFADYRYSYHDDDGGGGGGGTTQQTGEDVEKGGARIDRRSQYTQVGEASSNAQPPNKQPHQDSDKSGATRRHSRQQHQRQAYEQNSKQHPLLHEPEMPDTTYEEKYGDAYVGGTIKYVYPSGYQSMRPRGGPWKLSIVVCVFFTWLSVFIVGHCSDRAAAQQSSYVEENEIDDDEFVMKTRWCGSRPLYIMWVVSMLVTFLAFAYCSVIGYIKIRDFAVANSRSQPPGMAGKSEYYVRLSDDHTDDDGAASVASESTANLRRYQKSIYQADGTPAFWGSHIYRPTQAAVAVTSR
jgi:hypothetical protein